MAAFDPELISAYLDGELSRDERAQVEAWLAESARARQVLEQLRAVSGAMRTLPRKELGEDLTGEVLRVIAQREKAATASDRQDGSQSRLGVVGAHEQSASPCATTSPADSNAPARPVHRSLRMWHWLAPAAGLAAAVLIAVWIAQLDSNSGRVAEVAQRRRAAPAQADSADEDGVDPFAARARGIAPAEEPAMSKAPAGLRSDLTDTLESNANGAFAKGGRAGLGGASLGGEAAAEERDEALMAKPSMAPVELSVEELNPTLTVQSINEMGAAVVWVSTKNNRAGLTALKDALASNAILADQPAPAPADLGLRDEVANRLSQLQSLTAEGAGDEADALFVEADANQIQATLRMLKEGPQSKEIAKITVQVVPRNVLQQELANQAHLADEARVQAQPSAKPAKDDRLPRPASETRPAVDATEKAEAEAPLVRREMGRQQRGGAQAGQKRETYRFGRQVQLKWRTAPEQQLQKSKAQLSLERDRGRREANQPLGAQTGQREADVQKARKAELLRAKEQKARSEQAPPKPAQSSPAQRRLFARSNQDDKSLDRADSVKSEPLQILFVIESPPLPSAEAGAAPP